MSITRESICSALSAKMGILPKHSAEILEIILESIKSRLEAGEDVLIYGFGKWRVIHKAPRKVRNPKTGEEVILPDRKVVAFTPSLVLRRSIVGRAEVEETAT